MPTSFGIALAAQALGFEGPILLDIDDWEIAFPVAAEKALRLPWIFRSLKTVLPSRHPNSKALVVLIQNLVHRADAVTTVNPLLARHYGSEAFIVQHARDTDWLDPARFPTASAKSRMGLAGKSVVMFLGTPHLHKGIDDLAKAVASLRRRDIVIALVGCREDHPIVSGLRHTYGRLIQAYAPVPFGDLPQWLAAADIVALPQTKDLRALYQVPAKLSDAMAMGRPIVFSDLSCLRSIIGPAGIPIPPGAPRDLARAIQTILDDPERTRTMGKAARQRALDLLSYDAAAPVLDRAIESAFAARDRRTGRLLE